MPNGKPGDHPLTDLLNHDIRLFPDDICDSIFEINTIDPYAFQHDHEIGAVDWNAYDAKYGDWIGWYRESRFDEARTFLKDKPALAQIIANRRDGLADIVSSAVRSAFREWDIENATNSVQKVFTTYPAKWPEANLAATRIHWDLFVRVIQGHGEYLALVIETYPSPRILLGVTAIAEFAPGDAASTVEFLKSQPHSA